MSDKLKKIRHEIDKIDEQIIILLEKRLRLAQQTKELKPQITDLKREEEILSKISSSPIKKIYKAIFQASKEV